MGTNKFCFYRKLTKVVVQCRSVIPKYPILGPGIPLFVFQMHFLQHYLIKPLIECKNLLN